MGMDVNRQKVPETLEELLEAADRACDDTPRPWLSMLVVRLARIVRELARTPEEVFVAGAVRELNEYVEKLAAAFMVETGLKPSEAMVVQQLTPTGYRVWFQKKEPPQT